jgi:outer membrane biosynthesis protein TonB
VAKVLLTAQGVLARAQLVSSAGIDFLDQGALAALAAGTRLPGPPDDYGAVAGLVPLLVEFRHTVRRPGRPSPPPDVRVLSPKEQPPNR